MKAELIKDGKSIAVSITDLTLAESLILRDYFGFVGDEHQILVRSIKNASRYDGGVVEKYLPGHTGDVIDHVQALLRKKAYSILSHDLDKVSAQDRKALNRIIEIEGPINGLIASADQLRRQLAEEVAYDVAPVILGKALKQLEKQFPHYVYQSRGAGDGARTWIIQPWWDENNEQ